MVWFEWWGFEAFCTVVVLQYSIVNEVLNRIVILSVAWCDDRSQFILNQSVFNVTLSHFSFLRYPSVISKLSINIFILIALPVNNFSPYSAIIIAFFLILTGLFVVRLTTNIFHYSCPPGPWSGQNQLTIPIRYLDKHLPPNSVYFPDSQGALHHEGFSLFRYRSQFISS
jgi:hypothetical protein